MFHACLQLIVVEGARLLENELLIFIVRCLAAGAFPVLQEMRDR
ncbi:hypothetical protein [Fictibacillus fluitans]|uniref:Uncharacterized protein n=1 Tax=Fictibacillus fluitans TaxID=3058422 RepID=A0ABT8HY55_9BACL|nr:hypothetical protein [Fictibacillus sp. NE201]MDN4525702.1 hypothetical protein [Fictibacillus sp. NE201]